MKADNQNTQEDMILDYIRNIHPKYLQLGFCVTAEFIKLVEQINDKICDCTAIKADDDDRSLNTKDEAVNGMTDLQANDVFNNLPQEIFSRPLDSKTIEIIFDVYGKRAHAWFAEEYAEKDVSSALGLRNRGSAKSALHRYEEAITDYNRSIEIDPDSPNTFICRARAFCEIGNTDDASADVLRAYEMMIRINDCHEDFIKIAMIFEKCKIYDMVINCIGEYLRHVKSLEFYCDEKGDLWVVKEGNRSTSWCPTGNIIEIDSLDSAERILNRIKKPFETDDKQQKLLPFSRIDELRKELAITREKLDESIKKNEGGKL